MKKVVFVVSVIIFCIQLKAQSFEGVIGKGSVWVDLKISNADNSVLGSYFYKKNGVEIELSGTKNGKTISLTEKGDGQRITGYFNCTDFGDSITGAWRKNKNSSVINVKLYKTNPSYKEYAKIPKADELILIGGLTLGKELDEYTGEGYESEGKRPNLEVTYDQKNILSTKFSWSYMAAYPTDGTGYHTFNLTTKNEIALWEEIDEGQKTDFNKYLCQKIQPILTKSRKQYSDSEWADAFLLDEKTGNKKNILNKYFRIEDARKLKIYYISTKYVHFIVEHYFEFPHATQSMDLFTDIQIPFTELDKYLKNGSIFKRLVNDK